MKITLVGMNGRYVHSSMALFYVRNELVANLSEPEIEICQFTINDPYYQLMMQLADTEADCYLFSASIWNSDLVVKVARDLLDLFPDCNVIIGGPQAEVAGLAITRERCTVVGGEIEGVGQQFFQDLQNGDLDSRYVCSRAGKDFSLPYVPADFTEHLQNRHIYYESSRGCPFSCTYCLSASQKGVFHKDLSLVKKELSAILRHKPKVVRFVDRTFNDNFERSLAIWRFLAEQPVETLFHFEISPNHFSEEMFTFLQTLPVGKFQFEIGIQSTHPRTLQAIRRPMDKKVAHDTIARLSRMENIHLHVDLILGLPFDTKISFLNSFRDVFAMKPHYIQMGLLKILPDTPMCHTAEEFGYCYSSSTPYSVFANKWMDQRAMQEMFWYGECVERFLNNRYFLSLWDYFRQQKNDIAKFFEDLVEICRNDDFFQKAPTQKLLCSLLLVETENRKDSDYIKELLRYDWLRCGHRFLPPELDVDSEQHSRILKKQLYHSFDSPGSSTEVDTETRYFLKKGFIVEFSPDFMKNHGYSVAEGRNFLCFINDRDGSLHGFSRIKQLNLPMG